jgi:hypothetical protein
MKKPARRDRPGRVTSLIGLESNPVLGIITGR